MNRQNILKILAEHRNEIESRFDVATLSLFGSVAREEASEGSDIDILVTFIKTPGIFGFLELKAYLEKIKKNKRHLVNGLGEEHHYLSKSLIAFFKAIDNLLKSTLYFFKLFLNFLRLYKK